MKIGVLKESIIYENRVAITPESILKFKQLSFDIIVEENAGLKCGFSNKNYITSGASISTRSEIFEKCDIIISINAINNHDISHIKKPNQIFIGAYLVANNKELVSKLNEHKAELLSLELMPRISRAQAMDILSSQNNLAGYKSVLIAADCFNKAFPLMMTAAGMIAPAKVFIMGVGVAGLQAIATAKRLGAVVTAYDVRAATKEQVESLGAKFVIVDESVFENSEGKGGYAKELPEDYKKKEKEVISTHISKQDIVITTALIPGKKAPILITSDMVKMMIPGSVIIDLAAINGGNCELTKYNQTIVTNNVTIIGYPNLASLIPVTASNLFANNILNLFKSFYKKDIPFSFNYKDEIIKSILVTKNGNIVKEL